nr:hypothetical protein [Hyphomonas atlantica]
MPASEGRVSEILSNAEIIDKANGSRRNVGEGSEIVLDRPSVIVLKLAPENVARYERRGDDLILILRGGQKIVIQDFFVKHLVEADEETTNVEASEADPAEEGRNELVLEDDNGVVWWGQYPEEWSEFHFTEVELEDVAGAAWWPWLLGALGGGAGFAAIAAGDGGGGRQPSVTNPEPVA